MRFLFICFSILLSQVTFAGSFVNNIKEVSTWTGLAPTIPEKDRNFKTYSVREFQGRLIVTLNEGNRSEPGPIDEKAAYVLSDQDISQINEFLLKITTENGETTHAKVEGKNKTNWAFFIEPLQGTKVTYVGSNYSDDVYKVLKFIREIYDAKNRQRLSDLNTEKK